MEKFAKKKKRIVSGPLDFIHVIEYPSESKVDNN